MRRSSRIALKASAEREALANAPPSKPPSASVAGASLAKPATKAKPSAKPKAKPGPQRKKKKQEPQEAAQTHSGTDRDALMIIIRSLPDKMDRWQTAASCALASAFGPTGWKEFLQPFWLNEAHDLFPNKATFTTGPFTNNQTKKKAVRVSKMSADSIPETVPLELVGFARGIVVKQQVETEMEGVEEALGIRLNSRITRTRAMAEYRLNADDMEPLPHLSKPNPHNSNGVEHAPMRLYKMRDIVRTALLKHGGLSGLEDVQHDIATRKQKFRENKETKMQMRREELADALAEKGLEIRSDSYLCEQYINGSGRIPIRSVVDDAVEMDFYFKHTDYSDFLDDETESWMGEHFTGEPLTVSEKSEISSSAKARALSSLMNEKSVEEILDISDLPASVRRLVKQRQEKQQEQQEENLK